MFPTYVNQEERARRQSRNENEDRKETGDWNTMFTAEGLQIACFELGTTGSTCEVSTRIHWERATRRLGVVEQDNLT